MQKPVLLFSLIALAALVGAGVGLTLGRGAAEGEIADLRAEIAHLREVAERPRTPAEERGATRERARVETGLAATTAGLPDDPDAAAASDATLDVVGDAAGDDATAAEPAAALDPAQRRARAAEVQALIPVWLERGDGDAALSALRELAAMVPEGRDAAMALALAINADVSGEGRLRLSDVAFYSGLGDPGVKALMDWALPRADTPSGFRVMAVYSLPWTQSPKETLEQFRGALGTEEDTDVQRALVANIGRLRDPAAERLLADVLSRPDGNATLRAEAAGALVSATDPGVERALEIAAMDDPDASVRDAARSTLVARNPPATGYLVTGTLPESQASAAGLRAGDVLVRYGDTAVPTVDALRGAADAAAGQELVPVTLIRDGEEVRVLVRPGRLGIYGRAVEAAGE